MTRRPNVLLITTDHLRADTLGYAGDPVIKTAAIDELAGRSLRFTHCFSPSPVCQPSRATLMTGRYPRHHGVRWNQNALDENEMTLVEFFKRQGYRTASVGKHHIYQRRFDQATDHMEAERIRNMDPNNPLVQYVKSRGYEYITGPALPRLRERLGAVPSELPEDCHLDAYVGQRAQTYLAEADPSEPFFLWVGFYGPHHPYVPSGRFAHMYSPDHVPPFRTAPDDLDRKPVEYTLYLDVEEHKFAGFKHAPRSAFREMKAAYYATVSQIDWQIGLLFDRLREQGLAEHTIVVFTSDHGEFLGDHGLAGKGPFLLDCMLHVPLLICSPDGAHEVAWDGLVEMGDIFATIAELAGFEVPPWVQGRSLRGLVQDGDPPVVWRDAIWAEAVDKRCIRTHDWKLIHYPGKPYGELYHLDVDPWELKNVFSEEPDKRREMRRRLYDLMDATEDLVHPVYSQFHGIDPRTGETVRHYHTW